MGQKRLLILTLSLLFVWILAISVLRSEQASDIRWVNDNNDRLVYMQRAAWIVDGSIPYKDVFSEYPQIPNYFFALPYILLSLFQPIETINSFQYIAFFSFFMLIILELTIILLYKLLPRNKDRAFLLLLPASLYFTFNRFDILPAFLTLLSLSVLFRNKKIWAAIILGVGTMAKWYPALLLPIYLTYDYRINKKINWRMIAAFTATIFLVILPTYITGGWDAVMVPYGAHFSRGFELVSLPALLQRLFLAPLDINYNSQILGYFFLTLQFTPAFLSPFLKLDTKESVVKWAIVAIGFFIIFSPIYSPQWLLWFMPFLIVSAHTRRDIFLLVLYDLLIYLAFPVIVDTMGITSGSMVILNSISLILLITIVNRSFKQMGRKLSLNHAVDFFRGTAAQVKQKNSTR